MPSKFRQAMITFHVHASGVTTEGADAPRRPVNVGRQSVCQQRGTRHGLGSPPDTLEECFPPA
jgi:hypothetical protein